MILDGVVRASRQELGNEGPLVAVLAVRFQDHAIFFGCPWRLADVGVQMVMPPFTTLFADASGKVRGDLGPLARSKRVDVFTDDAILLLSPLAFLSTLGRSTWW